MADCESCLYINGCVSSFPFRGFYRKALFWHRSYHFLSAGGTPLSLLTHSGELQRAEKNEDAYLHPGVLLRLENAALIHHQKK
jgi:hypothetical protein